MGRLHSVFCFAALTAAIVTSGSSEVRCQYPSGSGPGSCITGGGGIQAVWGGWGSTFESSMGSCATMDNNCATWCEDCGGFYDGFSDEVGFPFWTVAAGVEGYEMPCGCSCSLPI